MNLSDMITYVRSQADTDSTDAPDATLEIYARTAYNDIRRRIPTLDDKVAIATFASVVGTASYAVPSGIEFVSMVENTNDGRMYHVAYPEWVRLRDGDNDYSTTYATHWTVRNSMIYLFPKPSSVQTYTVYGYAPYASWPSGSDEPDLPREFDEAISMYMLAMYYLGQEDLELYQLYISNYESLVRRFLGAANRDSAPSNRVFGRRPTTWMSYGDWVRRNTEG